jgi:hypothetical protein
MDKIHVSITRIAVIKRCFALPTHVNVALGARHVSAPAILLYADLALRTQRTVDLVFDQPLLQRLVCHVWVSPVDGASQAVMERNVARRAQ